MKVQATRAAGWPLVPVAIAALAAGACGGSGARANETTHPTSENVPLQGGVAITQDSVPRGLTRESGAQWAAARRMLLEARTVMSLGGDNDGGPEMFAAIADVEVGPGGEVFVLDDQYQEVRVFDAGGQFVGKIGGIGDGPLEFRYANGLVLLPDGRLFVSSRGPQAKVFVKLDGDGWVLDEVLELPIGVRGVCATGAGRVFVTGYKRDDNTLVHELAPHGGIARSFAPGYRSDHWLLQMQMGEGSVGCVNGPDRVVFAHSAFALVRAFDADTGTKLWSANIEAFDPLPVYEGVDGKGRRYVRRGREREWDVLGAVHPLPSGHLLLQSGHADAAGRATTVRTYLVDVETGRGAFLGDALPRLVPVRDGYAALFEDPYPRLELRAFPVLEGRPELSGPRRNVPGGKRRATSVAVAAANHERGPNSE